MFIDIENIAIKKLADEIKMMHHDDNLIDFRGNNLCACSQVELIELFESIPNRVTTIDLGKTELNSIDIEVFNEAFSKLKRNQYSIKLDLNDMKKLGKDLGNLLSIISSKSKEIILSWNDLGLMSDENIINAFSQCNQALNSIDLAWNKLDKKSVESLSKILGSLPHNLVSINLRENNLDLLNDAELAILLSQLSPSVTSVILSYKKIIDPSQFWVNHLIQQVQSIIDKKNHILDFKEISLPFEIDELWLNKLIQVLEKQNTPLTSLICALLLQGHINNTVLADEHCMDTYMEKRYHDAIYFYGKAAEDQNLKPIIDFLLWDLKSKTNLNSIVSKLDQADITPSLLLPNFLKFGQRQSATIPKPNSNELRFFFTSKELAENEDDDSKDNEYSPEYQ